MPAPLLRRVAAIALASVLSGAAVPAGAAAPDARPMRLTIAFTGDVAGYLEPCG